MNEVMALQLPVLHITCYTYKSKKDSKVGGQEGDRGRESGYSRDWKGRKNSKDQEMIESEGER